MVLYRRVRNIISFLQFAKMQIATPRFCITFEKEFKELRDVCFLRCNFYYLTFAKKKKRRRKEFADTNEKQFSKWEESSRELPNHPQRKKEREETARQESLSLKKKKKGKGTLGQSVVPRAWGDWFHEWNRHERARWLEVSRKVYAGRPAIATKLELKGSKSAN